MLNKLKLRGRILSGYSIPIAMSLLVTGLVIVNVNTVKQKFTLTENSHDILMKLKIWHLRYHISRNRLAVI